MLLPEIAQFVDAAKHILDGDDPLEDQKLALSEQLSVLSLRDDLTRYGRRSGPTDTSSSGFVLYREPPRFNVSLVQWDEHYLSPIHEHGDFWVIGCGYRGADRWDLYERTDDGSVDGHADIVLIDQQLVTPGVALAMPAPPRAIHSHNNVYAGSTLELIFSGADPASAGERLLYTPELHACAPSWYVPEFR